MNSIVEISATYNDFQQGRQDLVTADAATTHNVGQFFSDGIRLKFWPDHDPEFKGISFADALRIAGHMARDEQIKDPEACGLCTANNDTILDRLTLWRTQLKQLLGCLNDREWGLVIEDLKVVQKTAISMY